MILRRETRAVECFPWSTPKEFGCATISLPSRQRSFDREFHRCLTKSIELFEGDLVVLLTDAVAVMVLEHRRHSTVAEALEEIAAIDSQEAWASFIQERRAAHEIEDDDSTAIVLRLSNNPEKTSLGCSAAPPAELINERREELNRARNEQRKDLAAIAYGDGHWLPPGEVIDPAEVENARAVATALNKVLQVLRRSINQPDCQARLTQGWLQHGPLLRDEPAAAILRRSLAGLGVALTQPAENVPNPAPSPSTDEAALTPKTDLVPAEQPVLGPCLPLNLPDPEREFQDGAFEMVEMTAPIGTSQPIPLAIQGGSAIVYKFRTKSNQLRALRAITNSNRGDLKSRYETFHPYLRTHAAGVTVDFIYHDKGITLKDAQGTSHVYPLIDMEWVEGKTLIDTVNDLCRQGDRDALDQLGRRWMELLNILRAARMAHGDLSGNNVMVRPDGRLVLVGYDGIYIPAFDGQQAYSIGQPDYQHPDMANRPFNEWMDEFSWLAIHAALIALRVEHGLWEALVQYDKDGKLLSTNLLFEAKDYKDPGQSQVFSRLRQIREPNVVQAVEALAAACKMSIEQVRIPQEIITVPAAEI